MFKKTWAWFFHCSALRPRLCTHRAAGVAEHTCSHTRGDGGHRRVLETGV